MLTLFPRLREKRVWWSIIALQATSHATVHCWSLPHPESSLSSSSCRWIQSQHHACSQYRCRHNDFSTIYSVNDLYCTDTQHATACKARRTSWNKTEIKHWNCFGLISIFLNFNTCINRLMRAETIPKLFQCFISVSFHRCANVWNKTAV